MQLHSATRQDFWQPSFTFLQTFWSQLNTLTFVSRTWKLEMNPWTPTIVLQLSVENPSHTNFRFLTWAESLYFSSHKLTSDNICCTFVLILCLKDNHVIDGVIGRHCNLILYVFCRLSIVRCSQSSSSNALCSFHPSDHWQMLFMSLLLSGWWNLPWWIFGNQHQHCPGPHDNGRV